MKYPQPEQIWRLVPKKNGKLRLIVDLRFLNHRPVRLTEEAQQEIIWWRDNLHLWDGRSASLPPVTVKITTDASDHGWGATVGLGNQGNLVSVLEGTKDQCTGIGGSVQGLTRFSASDSRKTDSPQ